MRACSYTVRVAATGGTLEALLAGTNTANCPSKLWVPGAGHASGGPLGIDHRVAYDNSGIWKRSNQKALLYGSILTVGVGALAFGDNDKLGDTFWRSIDSMVVTGVTSTAMKYTFRRERPSQTRDPNRALALLPIYDAVARVKVHGHWQSDVLVGAALGTGIGLWSAHRSDSPIILGWLPGGFQIGFVHHFR
ncbi:undecaprenyl-diphosphatase [Luteibacter jiangsuensis]|uniref:Undecaprenyl-diphosphatase n=1 Tax=Luteibacter jiangsuensis TaxID=637577 RepID=A0ABT9SVC0_9GAMM|nr:phosphatase PAP2 family protein [Luteibacter jiangsuensis]MDQ0008288.1 undecaprenyl-diphosphatase [Luteibacter jiangsuensis]